MTKSTCTILSAMLMLSLCILATAAPYQELEPRKGHVPVYIRHGDEALSQIHPGLAEAFKEDNSQALQVENLVQEVPATSQPAAVAAETTTTTTTEKIVTTTVSDIASFDAIKAKDE